MSVPAFLFYDWLFSPMYMSEPAFGTISRITGDYPKSQNKPPEEGYWKDFQN
jgi:hypothetical protein